MLSKRRRLTAAQLQNILRKGRTVARRAGVSIKFFSTSEPLRAAVVVPKSTARSAVVRNRLRRAGYRALAAASLPQSGSMVVFIHTPPADMSELADTLYALLKNVS